MTLLPEPFVGGASTVAELAELCQRNFEAILLDPDVNAPFIGTGNPNGVVTASPPATYLNRAGGAGTTFWVKESGVNTNTGWVAK